MRKEFSINDKLFADMNSRQLASFLINQSKKTESTITVYCDKPQNVEISMIEKYLVRALKKRAKLNNDFDFFGGGWNVKIITNNPYLHLAP